MRWWAADTEAGLMKRQEGAWRQLGPSALICDPVRGGVYLPDGKALYTGPSPEDFLLGSS